MITYPETSSSITQLPGQEDLVATSVSPALGPGAAYVPVDEDADFVQPPGRGAASFALGTSMAIDNSGVGSPRPSSRR